MNSSVEIDWTAVGSIATALALVLGICTLYWQHRSQVRRDEHDRSRFALDSCLAAYRTALERLEDGNNDRVTWVTSARIIQRANELSSLVTEVPHIAALEVEREVFRDRAAGVLGYDNPSLGDWFFQGFDGPDQKTAGVKGRSRRSYSRNTQHHGGKTELSVASVATVYELALFPKNYEEPLRDHKLDEQMGIEMRVGFPGLFKYLTAQANLGRTSPDDKL